jgi:hypothetical protein
VDDMDRKHQGTVAHRAASLGRGARSERQNNRVPARIKGSPTSVPVHARGTRDMDGCSNTKTTGSLRRRMAGDVPSELR